MELKTLILVTIVLLVTGSGSSQHCVGPQAPATDVDFSLHTYRNKSGHLVSQVQLGLENQTGKHFPENPERWQVDLKQRTINCDGVTTVKIIATLSGPPLKTSESITEPPPAPGYKLHPTLGSYYKFHTTGKTWDEARRICEEEGAHLAVINSQAEAQELKDTFVTGSHKMVDVQDNGQASIGFHDRFVNGEYLTILGTTLARAGFSHWDSVGLPDNAGGKEHCGSLGFKGGLNDIPCDTLKLAFICEKELK